MLEVRICFVSRKCTTNMADELSEDVVFTYSDWQVMKQLKCLQHAVCFILRVFMQANTFHVDYTGRRAVLAV